MMLLNALFAAALAITSLASLVIAVLLVVRVRVAPVGVALFVTLPVVGSAAASLFLFPSQARPSIDTFPFAERLSLWSSWLAALTGWVVWTPILVLPMTLLLLACAIAASRWRDSTRGLALLPPASLLTIGIATLVSAIVFESLALVAWTTAVGAGLLLVWAVLGALTFRQSAHPVDTPRAADAVAASGLTLLGAVCAMYLGLMWMSAESGLNAVAIAYDPFKMEAAFLSFYGATRVVAVAAAILAAAVALAGVGARARALGAWTSGSWLAIPLVLVAPGLLWASDPLPVLQAYGQQHLETFYGRPSADFELAQPRHPTVDADVELGNMLRTTTSEVLLNAEPIVALEQTTARDGSLRSTLPDDAESVLVAALTGERSFYVRNPYEDHATRLVLQFDRRTPYATVSTILSAAQQAGYVELDAMLTERRGRRLLWSDNPVADSTLILHLTDDTVTVDDGSGMHETFSDGEIDDAIKRFVEALPHNSRGDEATTPVHIDVRGDVPWQTVASFLDTVQPSSPMGHRGDHPMAWQHVFANASLGPPIHRPVRSAALEESAEP